MNIAYIGSKDALSYQFIQHMCREEDEIYFISNDDFTHKKKSSFSYKFFKLTNNEEVLNNILTSVKPDVMVFGGFGYMDELWVSGGATYVSLLHNVLEYCAKRKISKFIYLSSVEVYGEQASPIDEDARTCPITNKGTLCAQGEYMVSLYHQRDHLPVSILRVSQIYGNECSWNSYDFLSNIYRDIAQKEAFVGLQDEVLYPVHAADVADGIKRTIEFTDDVIFNITGSFPVKRTEIYRLAAASLNKNFSVPEKLNMVEQSYSTEKIQKKTEWIDFKNLGELFTTGKITYNGGQKHEPEKKRKVSDEARKTIENVIVFSVFYGIYLLCMSHTLFSKIDWLLIYVTITSLVFGIGQSALSVVLASGGFLLSQNLSILEMNNFYSYAESVLAIVQFIFFGICVSYTTDQLKEKLGEFKRREELITEEYQELKSINQQNVYIKNEYEKRLLESKTSMPQLYDIVKSIMVLSPDRIFMEVIQVVAKVIETNTVAIYMMNPGSTYLRLINSLNESSVVGGKSWNIADYPRISSAIDKSEIYQGNTFEDEPAVVVPISQSSKGLAIMVIKELPYDQQTLYQMNVLTTLLALIRDAIDKAFAYEKEVRAGRYIADSSILISTEFDKSISLAKEKQEKGLADFCVLAFVDKKDIQDLYSRVENIFRVTDSFGVGRDGELYLLLNNTSEQDVPPILERMERRGVCAVVCTQAFLYSD